MAIRRCIATSACLIGTIVVATGVGARLAQALPPGVPPALRALVTRSERLRLRSEKAALTEIESHSGRSLVLGSGVIEAKWSPLEVEETVALFGKASSAAIGVSSRVVGGAEYVEIPSALIPRLSGRWVYVPPRELRTLVLVGRLHLPNAATPNPALNAPLAKLVADETDIAPVGSFVDGGQAVTRFTGKIGIGLLAQQFQVNIGAPGVNWVTVELDITANGLLRRIDFSAKGSGTRFSIIGTVRSTDQPLSVSVPPRADTIPLSKLTKLQASLLGL